MDRYDTDTDVSNELPTGLAMAFAQDTDALVLFTAMSTEDQDDIIRRARRVHTKNEMTRLINERIYGE